MIEKSTCQSCSGGIEFDAADFIEQSRTSTHRVGQEITCPHCGSTTPIKMQVQERRQVARPGRGIAVRRIIIVMTALIGGLIASAITYFLLRSGTDFGSLFAGGIGAFVGIIIIILAIVLAVFWLVFPWMVYAMLSKIHAELIKIERNTRVPR